MFMLIQRFACVYLLMINIIFLFFKKFFIYFNNLFDILFFYVMKKSKMRHIVENFAHVQI